MGEINGLYKIGAVVGMVFLYSVQSLLITGTQNSEGGYNYKPNSAVLMTEFAKLCVASTFLFFENQKATPGNEPKVTVDMNVFRYALPAALYAVHNNMVSANNPRNKCYTVHKPTLLTSI